ALPKFTPATRADIDAAALRGARFLLAAGPGARWGAPGEPDVGLTAMAVSGLQAVSEPRPSDIQAAIDDAQTWIVSHQKEDGSIHQGRLANYVTSVSVMALASNEEHKDAVEKARNWIVGIQADEGEGYSEGDIYYGGIGYGSDERPDLSNLQMALEALVAAGETSDSKSIQNALKYLERCQNRSETNDVEVTRDGIVIKSGNDGGAGYAPGDSKAGFVELEDGTKVPRSYGSMSYALLKGFVFAGLSKDDPRVAACWKWLSDNYTLDVNPGFDASAGPVAPYQGLYYYFHTMGKALDVYGVDTITDGDGVEHDWRAELAGRLAAMQSKDGSWVNTNAPRWWEGNPLLATAYALQTLAATRK
ncbi:MAG: prenyltransferase/squalene oxidase repeat-containing protein, partial [Planctomycetota bacterium]